MTEGWEPVLWHVNPKGWEGLQGGHKQCLNGVMQLYRRIYLQRNSFFEAEFMFVRQVGYNPR